MSKDSARNIDKTFKGKEAKQLKEVKGLTHRLNNNLKNAGKPGRGGLPPRGKWFDGDDESYWGK